MQWGHPRPRSGEGDAKRDEEEAGNQMVSVSDDDRIAAAQSYIDALVSHNGDAVPFAPDCIRIEQGLKTGFSGNHLRRSLNRGPQFRIIAATTQPEYTINGDKIRAVYNVVTKVQLGGRRFGAHVDETFVIPSGDAVIHHIGVRMRPFFKRI
jgi:hypothetical protein